MWTASKTIGLVACITAFACSGAPPPPPTTVADLDVDRFMGTWYEVARLPFHWQRDCVASAARYEKVSDEEFAVVNYCWFKTIDGPMRKARAKAYVDTAMRRARLKIQFFWPNWQDYWVLYISDDYQQTVIGTPDRKYLWLMSRTPSMDEKIYDQLVAFAAREGFDTASLMNTMQTAPPEYTESAETAADGKGDAGVPEPTADNAGSSPQPEEEEDHVPSPQTHP